MDILKEQGHLKPKIQAERADVEAGSIEEVTARLRSWCQRNDRGRARVEFDQYYACQEVVNRLCGVAGKPLAEIEVPAGKTPPEVVLHLMERLESCKDGVASITGIEMAYATNEKWLDTLADITFRRESLAALPVLEIWWIPSHLTEQFVLGTPDLDSWFQVRLELTEKLPQAQVPAVEGFGVRTSWSVEEARGLARRFWDRYPQACKQDIPVDQIWADLAAPAVTALSGVGLQAELNAMLETGIWQVLESRLEELRKTLGSEDAKTLRLTEQLSELLLARRDRERAVELLTQVVTTRRRVLGEDHSDTLSSINNLALTRRAQGDSAGAMQRAPGFSVNRLVCQESNRPYNGSFR